MTPSTLLALSLHQGHNVLTIGYDEDVAREISHRVGIKGSVLVTDQVTNLTFQQLACNNKGGTFDRILCRIALSRLNKRTASSLVEKMFNSLNPLGKLVLEEDCTAAPKLIDLLERRFTVLCTIPSTSNSPYDPHQTIAQISLIKYY